MVCVKGKQAADVFSLDQEVFALDRLLKRIDDNSQRSTLHWPSVVLYKEE